jgi:condensin complex subunit 2
MSATTARLSTADTAGQPTPATSQNKAAADEDDDDYAADDYGGDDDDDDGDLGFDQFISNDANGDRYSSISFQNDADFDDTQTTKTTTALLNALCSDMTRNDYQFFSQESLDKLGNAWAGASHWKKSVTLAKAAVKKPDTTKRTIAKKRKKFQPVDFEADVSSIPDLLKPAQLNKRGTDPTQLSKAMISKHGKVDNILPLDARMSVDQLYKLFLRPNAIVRPNQKTVNFQEHVDNWDDGSCGGDDVDGPGFELNDDSDDFVVTELSDVRKIDKIQVGYATVAKKVDVKRLKNDLWTELESKIGQKDVDIDVTPEEGDGTSPPEKLSFKETVQEMEMQGQTQTDVTLPFYFICLLHLANEKGLELESRGLHDFFIS